MSTITGTYPEIFAHDSGGIFAAVDPSSLVGSVQILLHEETDKLQVSPW